MIMAASFRDSATGSRPARNAAGMTTHPTLLVLLQLQDGLVTCTQAEQHGLAGRTLRRRARDDGWNRVAPRVYLAGGHRYGDRARVRAAGLWAGEAAAVSGPAAAWRYGMVDAAPAEVVVTVPRHLGIRGYPGVTVRRRDLDPADVTRVHGLRLTSRALTALETAIEVPDGSVFLDRALQKYVPFREVYLAYCRNMGARGFARVAALLTAAADRADSAAERILIKLLRDAGITGWTAGAPFEQWKIDIAFPDIRLAVEIDSWAWHTDVQRFRADRHKGNALVRAGWTVLRFTWHDLTNRPGYVLAQIRAALLTAAATA
jgi:very-short-patch-repair endonuclease